MRQLAGRFLREVRRILRRAQREVYRLATYPQTWAAIAGTRMPSASIYEAQRGLARPEGLAFAPAGDLLAACYVVGNSVRLYTRKNEREAAFHNKPSFTIINSETLSYVHGVAFSACGTMLAAAARDAHSVSIFVRKTEQPIDYDVAEACLIHGAESRLGFPAGVSFHPNGEYLGVANRGNGGGITLYRLGCHGDGSDINPVLVQSIGEEDLLTHDLAAPHDVDFSPDGAFLFVTHKRFFETQNPRGKSGVSIFRCHTSPEVRIDPNPKYVSLHDQDFLHSVAVHPSGRYFSVINERKNIEVFAWRADNASVVQVDSIPIFKSGQVEGAKGVAFTSDGKQLAVTTALDQILLYSNWKTSPG